MVPRSVRAGVSVLALAGSLAACSSTPTPSGGPDGVTGHRGSGVKQASAHPSVRTSIPKGAHGVAVDTVLRVRAEDARLRSVSVTSPVGSLPGRLIRDRAAWAATDGLEPGTTYTVKTVLEGGDGTPVVKTSRFSTQPLTLDEQTYPSVAPLPDETVGVGMPVIVSFDVPVTDKAEFERHMRVTASPRQPGSWHWMSDTEAHWRPKTYWKPGTEVDVDIDVNGVSAGGGIYGQEDREVHFSVGDAHIYRVNMVTHQMKVFSNGSLLRTIPITTGEQPKFTTRSGVKVIIEKFDSKRMNSETIGIPPGSPDAYDIDNVQWAMRVTYSGEFVHAAPWSVASQGRANVSHGCTGMSTANADWLYHMSVRGDVVEYTGTDRPMELSNGYGDWNLSFAEYAEGSALS